MRHLLSYSVYQDMGFFGDDVQGTLSSVGCDGLELLTSTSPVDPVYIPHTVSVHLPYATDWMAAWQGRAYEMDPESAVHIMYGRDREEVVSNLVRMMEVAAPLSPVHGVLHASNADLPEIMMRRYTRDSREVLREFSEMVNTAVSMLPGGEPPFRLLFENLWWPGLRLLDESDYRYLGSRIEFDNWGVCLDTGHMMNCIPDIRTESDGIGAVMDVVTGYGDDLIEHVHAVHFHYSASGEYRATFEERPMDLPPIDFVSEAYGHVSTLDQHMPFTDPRCAGILDVLRPDTVVHEMPGSVDGPLEDFRRQRALLPP